MKIGRPTKYKTEYLEATEGYLALSRTNVPSVRDFVAYLGVSRKTVYNWEKESASFKLALTRIRRAYRDNYVNLHYWVKRHLGTPEVCEHCGKSGLSGVQIHWANKSGEYKRELSDWLRLCTKCHKKYDSQLTTKASDIWQVKTETPGCFKYFERIG